MEEAIKVGKNLIGKGAPVFIIAEIGINHNGSIELAKKMIASAAKNMANCVKFQTFRADRVVTPDAPKAKYKIHIFSYLTVLDKS